MNELNFSNNQYKEKALNFAFDESRVHSPEDAFFLLVNGISYDDLDNLCLKIQNRHPTLSLEKCYKLTQDNSLNKEIKKEILDCAYECISEQKHLGNKTILEGKINTSSWLSHSLNSSIVTKILAENLNLNPEVAQTMGLLHDFGRKYTHSFDHTITGFEKLLDCGYYDEAVGTLTHSFVNGGRCANNEPALEGFNLDENGKPYFEEGTKKDDITLFLENYKYSDYDMLLTISDLVATDKGITSLEERLNDIATRRVIDPKNRNYFLSEIINVLNSVLYNCGYIDNLNKTIPKEENINEYLKATSNIFNDYITNIILKEKTINQKNNC